MKKLIIITLVLVVSVVLINNKLIEFKWLTSDMGWCQEYDKGLRVNGKTIFVVSSDEDKPSICV